MRGVIAKLAALQVAVFLAFSSPILSGPAYAQDLENAPVISWGQFLGQLDSRQLKNFTGVSGGYVAFNLCNGRWFRVRASVADVVNALDSRSYRSACPGGVGNR